MLIKDNRVMPDDNNNFAIKSAYQSQHFDIVDLLWKVPSVKNKLKINYLKLNCFDLYSILIKKETHNKISDF